MSGSSQPRLNWSFCKSSALFVGSAVTAAAVVGGVAGLLGSTVAPGPRLLAAVLLSSAAVVFLAVDIWRRIPLPQLERQTQKRWVEEGAARWAVKTGSELGVGISTRIAFPVWYAVPLASVLVGSPLVGASVWGAYALTRAGGSVVLAWYSFIRAPGSQDDQTVALFDRLPKARSVTDAAGIVSVIVLVVGLW